MGGSKGENDVARGAREGQIGAGLMRDGVSRARERSTSGDYSV